MEIEAALPPPSIRLNTTSRKYAFRALRLPTEHPISKALGLKNTDFPGQDDLSSPARFKEPQTTQLNRIKNSISELGDFSLLEPLRHFYFPPWNKTPPFTVNISELPKEEAALAHASSLKSLGKDDVLIYSDALVLPEETTGVGIGLVVLEYNTTSKSFEKTHQQSANIGPSQLVYNGELKGVTRAMEHTSLQAKPGRYFHIYSDNKAGIFRLQTPSDKPDQSHQIRAYKAAKTTTDLKAKISIEWVPGHNDIPGNELADSLAKRATKLPPESMEVSYASLSSKLKETSI